MSRSPDSERPSQADRDEAKRERRTAAREERERHARRARALGRARAATIAIVLGLGAIGLTLGLVRDLQPSGVAFAGDLRPGGTLEELRLPRLEGDGVIEYGDYAGRPLVINFFASWCPNCIAEMPDFEHVHALLGGEVGFLGISQSDARSASIELAKETGITYATAIDERGQFFNAVGGQGMPTTVFVGPDGEIAEIWVGALDADTLRALISDHFGITA